MAFFAKNTINFLHTYSSFFIILAMVFLSSSFLHKTHNYLDTVPIARDDDAISNVAVNLWKSHRYGFSAHPVTIHPTVGTKNIVIPKGTHFQSLDHYYNYGWFYFITAGFLNWTFGDDSLLFFRMITPWCFLAISILAIWFFRGSSFLPGSILAITLFWRFLLSVSPAMARPDIAVSLAAVLFFISAYFAYIKSNFFWWFLVGFWACTTATSHLVAWTIVPIAVLVWVGNAVFLESAKDQNIKSFLGVLFGGIFSFFLYLWMIGFRIGDVFVFISTLQRLVNQGTSISFIAQLISGAKVAWTSSGFTFFAAVLGTLSSIILLIFSFRSSIGRKRKIFALLLAPLLTNGIYTLSLGFYQSIIQTGYGILIYVSALWLLAATVAAIIFLWTDTQNTSVKQKIIFNSNCSAFLLLLFFGFKVNAVTANLEKLKYGWVKFSEYEKQILDSLPSQAYAWGWVNLGLQSGTRKNLVNFNSAYGMGLYYNQRGWEKIAPDYLLLNSYTLEGYLVSGTLAGKDSPLAILHTKLPAYIRYHLVRIVYAPPYGNTFIYKKIDTKKNEIIPPITVAANDGSNQEWYLAIGESLQTKVSKTSPVAVDMSLWGEPVAQAKESLQLELPRGFYLIHMKILNSSTEQTGTILATASPYFYVYGDTRLQHAPLFRGDTEAKFLIDHLGGPLYLSYFPGRASSRAEGSKNSKIEIVSVKPLLGGNTVPVSLPDFSQWKLGKAVKTELSEGVLQLVAQEQSEVEPVLISPEILVEPYSAYSLLLPMEVYSGSLQVAIQSKQGEMLLWGEKQPLPQRIGFYSGNTNSISVKIYIGQNSIKATPTTPTRVNILQGLLFTQKSRKNNIESLLTCYQQDQWLDENGSNLCEPIDQKKLDMVEQELLPLQK